MFRFLLHNSNYNFLDLDTAQTHVRRVAETAENLWDAVEKDPSGVKLPYMKKLLNTRSTMGPLTQMSIFKTICLTRVEVLSIFFATSCCNRLRL